MARFVAHSAWIRACNRGTTMRNLKSAAFAALFVMAGTLGAFAHAKMNASVPKDGATVPAGLSEIQLQFSKPLRLTLIHVRRVDDQEEIPARSKLPKSFVDSAKVAVEALQAGSYKVFWTAVSKDGHVMKGSFAFSVKQSPDAAASPAVVAPEQASENENSAISAASMETDKTVEENTVEIKAVHNDESKTTSNVGLSCKKFFPAVGKTLTVACW